MVLPIHVLPLCDGKKTRYYIETMTAGLFLKGELHRVDTKPVYRRWGVLLQMWEKVVFGLLWIQRELREVWGCRWATLNTFLLRCVQTDFNA